MIVDRRKVLAALGGTGALTLAPRAFAISGGDGSPREFATLAGGLSIPVGPSLDPEKKLTRIGIGSCFNQTKPGTLLGTALRAKPDLFLFMGDNVYGDTESPDLDELLAAYAGALARPDYRHFRRSVPIAAVWDDHDFGLNDAGASYAYKEITRPLFFDFWGVPADSPRRGAGGVQHAFIAGPPGARVQIILLDTRNFRDAWRPTDHLDAPGKQRYMADPNPSRTILGAEQWRWLEEQLARPADLRIVVTSYQLVADGHGWERWGLFPHERRRFYDLVASMRANGVFLVSGDRHRAGIYRETRRVPYPIHELTSSAINMSWAVADDPGEERGPNRIGPTFRQNNVGLVTLDWERREVGYSIMDANDRVVLSHRFGMGDLRA